MNPKKNLKNATKKENLLDILFGSTIGVFIYAGLPTVLKLKGPAALGVGTVASWLAGALTGQRGIQYAGPICAAIHLAYVYGNNVVYDVLGRPIWQYSSTGSPSAVGMNDVIGVNGERVAAQMPMDLPAPSQGVQDYIPQDYNPNQLSGYVGAESSIIPSPVSPLRGRMGSGVLGGRF